MTQSQRSNILVFTWISFWKTLHANFAGVDTQSILSVQNFIRKVYRETINHSKLVAFMTEWKLEGFRGQIEYVSVFRDGDRDDRFGHTFVVFKTSTFYFSIERLYNGIMLQCSPTIELEEVIERRNRYSRYNPYQETDWADGQDST